MPGFHGDDRAALHLRTVFGQRLQDGRGLIGEFEIAYPQQTVLVSEQQFMLAQLLIARDEDATLAGGMFQDLGVGRRGALGVR